MSTQTYTVDGITCGHCAGSVTDEVSGIAGVTSAEVDLDAGTVTVVAASTIDDAAVAAAVTEAGYRLTGRA